MAPIRVALIGLSAGAKTEWASAAHLSYLLSPRGKQQYKIIGLLNSTKQSGEKAIAHYELPAQTKAYSSPDELAADNEVQFVVCSTRVDVHYPTVKASVIAGKDAFVEWPLAENKERAAELADLARKHNVRTLVGLQGRIAPVILKVKELLNQGVIGKVLSSEVRTHTAGMPRGGYAESLSYFADKKIGGNPVTILVGHTLDWIHFVLGEYKTSHAQGQIQRPNVTFYNRKENTTRTGRSDVPDLLSVHGTLHESDLVVPGATLQYSYRHGPPFPGTPAYVWTINGERGEMRIVSQQIAYIQSEASGHPVDIEVVDAETGEITKYDWGWKDWQVDLPARGRNTAAQYDSYALGKELEDGFATFEGAAARHREIDGYLEQVEQAASA